MSATFFHRKKSFHLLIILDSIVDHIKEDIEEQVAGGKKGQPEPGDVGLGVHRLQGEDASLHDIPFPSPSLMQGYRSSLALSLLAGKSFLVLTENRNRLERNHYNRTDASSSFYPKKVFLRIMYPTTLHASQCTGRKPSKSRLSLGV